MAALPPTPATTLTSEGDAATTTATATAATTATTTAESSEASAAPPALFKPLKIREVEFSNRIGVSPMCQYSCHGEDGKLTDWHVVNLGSRCFATGLELVEATAVEAVGRISPQCPGLWEDGQIAGHRRLVDFVHRWSGCKIGVQLAHAGRKGSTLQPWLGRGGVTMENGGQPVSSTAVPFSAASLVPRVLSAAEIRTLVDVTYPAAIRRAEAAGYDFIEIHAAHGYLLHQFYSPLINDRTDDYGGGSFDNRVRLLLEIAAKAREVWGAAKPLFVRISCTDWADNGWDLDQSVELARRLKAVGVDLIDCSSGGGVSWQKVGAPIGVAPGYQLPFAARIRAEAAIATAAVGLITSAADADAIVANGTADIVLLGREFLRQPYFSLAAAQELHPAAAAWPDQYLRAVPAVARPTEAGPR